MSTIVQIFRSGTPLKHPIAFTPAFYEAKETQQRGNNFLSSMGKEDISFKDVVRELSNFADFIFEIQPLLTKVHRFHDD